MTELVTVGTVPDMLEIIPCLLGFEPEESLVLVLTEHGRTLVTARVDLVDITGHVDELLGQLWERFPNADAYTVVYSADRDAANQMLETIDLWLPRRLGRMLVWVGPKGWTCGADFGALPAPGEIRARMASLGMTAEPSRKSLEDALSPAPFRAELADLLNEKLYDTAAGYDAARELRALIQTAGPKLSVDDATALGLLVSDPYAQLVAMSLIDRENADEMFEMWRQVVTLLPVPFCDSALMMAGISGWQTGNGALASVALEKLAGRTGRAAGPAMVLDSIISGVCPPSMWPEMRPVVDRSAEL